MKSMVELSHDFLLPALHSQAICIDATLGQGKDAQFFLDHSVKKVYGFEIQKEVFCDTIQKMENSCLEGYLLGHEHMDEVVHESVDAIVFNFGYFPSGTKEITTDVFSSVEAVKKAYHLLKIKGRMALVLYPHEAGRLEATKIEECVCTISNCQVHKITNFMQDNCPYLILIEKRR